MNVALTAARVEELKAAVEYGARTLDVVTDDGWWWLIDTVRLNMVSLHDCVAGQLWGSFLDAPNVVQLWPVSSGFIAAHQWSEEEAWGGERVLAEADTANEYLATVWTEQIDLRREQFPAKDYPQHS